MSDQGLQMLFGADPAEGLVGVAASPHGMHLWWRRGEDTVHEEEAFKPWFLLSHRHLLDDFKPEPHITELNGGNYYKYRVECLSWDHHDAAVKHVNRFYRANKADFDSEPVYVQGDPVIMYLLDSGRTHFKGMTIEDARTLFI